MKTRLESIIFLLVILIGLPVFADDIHLDFVMPGDMFGPGSPFSLELAFENTSGAVSNAELFVALTVGTGDYWFYPSWVMFPPDIDWETVFVPAYSSDQWMILPEFSWPHGAGSFDGAMFLGAITYNGDLISNLAECMFGWSEAPQPTPTPTPAVMEFVYIYPGAYTRGAAPDEPCRNFWGEEDPPHEVTLTRGFNMMTTGVTRQMWVDLKAVQSTLPDDPSDVTKSPTMDHPVQNISWYEAVLFANLLSLEHGYTRCYYKDEAFTIPVDDTNYFDYDNMFYCDFDADGYRLPTEAEWEYAARAGTMGAFSAHEPNYNWDTCDICDPDPPLNVLDEIAWWCGNTGGWPDGTAHPVGTKQPNPWGLYDVHGNVSEWCWDWFYHYPSDPVTDPTGPYFEDYRIVRGGSWRSDPQTCRSAYRGYTEPFVQVNTIGFRLVQTANGTQPTPTPSVPTTTPTPSGPTPTPPPAPTWFVNIPPGDYLRGSDDDPCARTEESPRHEVTLTRGFEMMTTAVTRQMWADLKAVQPTLPDDPSDVSISPTMDHPVQKSTWYEAVLFANLMSAQYGFTPAYYKDEALTIPVDATNYIDYTDQFYCNFDTDGYRLPTEAEWEYAARAGTIGPFSTHEPNYSEDNCDTCDPDPPLNVLDEIAWWCGNTGGWPDGTAHPVATKQPNPWGLYDVHGNMRTWCWDWYGMYPSEPVTDPAGSPPNDYRVYRGGCWGFRPTHNRSAFRGKAYARSSENVLGFRLVRTVH